VADAVCLPENLPQCSPFPDPHNDYLAQIRRRFKQGKHGSVIANKPIQTALLTLPLFYRTPKRFTLCTAKAPVTDTGGIDIRL